MTTQDQFAASIVAAVSTVASNAATNAANAAVTTALGARTSEGRNHAAKPEKFDGSPSTYKSWKRSVELYVAAITSTKNKVLAALSFLAEGDADQYARNYIDQNKADLDAGNITLDTFFKALDAQFANPREGEFARKDLFAIKMGTDQTAQNFFLKVDELRVRGDWTDPDHHDRILVEYLQRRMPHKLVLAVSNAYEAQKAAQLATIDLLESINAFDHIVATFQRGRVDVPISYKNFRDISIQQDPFVKRFGDDPKAESTRPSTNKFTAHRDPPRVVAPAVQAPRPAAPATSTAPPSTVATGSQVHSHPGSQSGETPMEVDRARHAHDLCYTCGQKGHKSWNCPTNPQRFNIRELGVDQIRALLAEVNAEDDEEDF